MEVSALRMCMLYVCINELGTFVKATTLRYSCMVGRMEMCCMVYLFEISIEKVVL